MSLNDLTEIGSPPSLVLINFPGTVRDENQAIGMLGKMEKLDKCFPPPGRLKRSNEKNVPVEELKERRNNRESVELRFRPGDVLSQPIQGVTRPTKKLLLKVTTNDTPSNRSVQNVTLEGIVDEEVVFEDLCDFQRVEATIHNYNEKDPSNKTFNLPAVRFSSRTRPTHYKMTTRSKLRKMEESSRRRVGKTGRRRKGVVLFDFDVPNIPIEPEESVKRDNITDVKLMKYVRYLFDKRSIWLPLNLEVMCKKKFPEKRITTNILKLIVNQVAYKFRNGPFKRVFIKYGVDPRKDPNMAKYQTVDFRPKVETWGKEPSVFFDRPPYKQITYYQVCDIRISSVIDFMEKDLTLLSSCKKDYGWFKKGDIVEKIPGLMKEKLSEWLEEEGYHRNDKDIKLPDDEIYEVLKTEQKKEVEAMDVSED